MAAPRDQSSLIGDDTGPRKRAHRTARAGATDEVLPPASLIQRPAGLDGGGRRLYLGTSSWAFPGWRALVYRDQYTESALARHGLRAYAAHPLLNGVGIDRGFYAALSVEEYAGYASQVGEDFRFLVKAPDLVTSATRRTGGGAFEENPSHLDPTMAFDQFIGPCLQGLGRKAGVLVFQISPLPRATLRDPRSWIDRLDRFLAALPPLPSLPALPASSPPPAQSGHARRDGESDFPRYALELRDPTLLTPRLMKVLASHRVLYCLSLHARMPPIERQMRALDAAEQGRPGPLVARWNLHAGLGYDEAKKTYAPFDRLVDEDPVTRTLLAGRAARVLDAGQPVMVIANNKAEGSAPRTLEALARSIASSLG